MFEKGKFLGGKIANGGRFIGGKAKQFKQKADNIRSKVNDYGQRLAKKHPKLANGIKGAKTLGANTLRRSMPIALGMMGMAMSYSTGSSGAMEAIGVGSGLQRGSEEFLANSQGTIEGNVQESVNEDVESTGAVKDAQDKLDENEAQIEETNDSLRSTNSTIEKMSEADQDKGNEYLDLLREEAKNEAQMEALRAKGDEATEKELKKLQQLGERQAEIAARKGEIENDSSFASALPTFQEKHRLEQQLADQKNERLALLENAQITRKAAALAIIEGYRQNGGAAQIARAKAEITKAIQKCMLEQKYKDGQSDVSAEYTLSDKETRSAERMQESISALLDRAVVAGGGSLDAGEVYKRFFGQDSDSPMAESLKQAIDAYQYQARAKNYNDNEDLYKGTGGIKEKFEDDISTKASRHG